MDGAKSDGCDGTISWLRVDDQVPAGARQPDGSFFMPEAPVFVITSVTRDPGTGRVTLAWPSAPAAVYDVYTSFSLTAGSWSLVSPAGGLPSAGSQTTFTDASVATNPANADEGTIRKTHALSIGENSVHGSDAPETAAEEIAYWFSGTEIVG